MKIRATNHHPALVAGAVYLLSVLAMATVGMIVPFVGNFAQTLGVGKSAIGLAIALFSAPTAIFAVVGGGIIDRFGPRPALLAAAGLMAGGDLIVHAAPSLFVLYGGMIVSGIGFGVVAVGGPAMLIAATRGSVRQRALSFLSTYAPTGFAVGLLIAIPFADGPSWRSTQLVHAGLLVVALLLNALILPSVHASAAPRAQTASASFGSLLSVFRNVPLIRLAIAIAIANCISYGTSLVAPSYLAQTHHISLASSAGSVAFAKIFAMTVGGLVMGHLLARNLPERTLFVAVALTGMVAQLLLYLPASNLIVAVGALIVWLFVFGGLSGTAMALLPRLVSDPSRSGAASGLVNQFISVFSFLTPSIYFGLTSWTQYVVIAVGGLAVAILVAPGAREADPGAIGRDAHGSA